MVSLIDEHVCFPATIISFFDSPRTNIAAPHPVWRPHLFQGWAADFIPKLVCKADKSEYIDEVIHPGGDDAINTSRALAAKEGIFSGTSGGGVLACAIKIAETAPEGTSILAIIPDTGERYLSTPLFDNIPADMTEEEKALAESSFSMQQVCHTKQSTLTRSSMLKIKWETSIVQHCVT